MQIIEWQQFTENPLSLDGKLTSMTVGVFDGIHTGHAALLNRILSNKNIPVVITFRKNNNLNIISFKEKLAMLEKLGIKITVVIDFTESFMRITGKEFLDILLKNGSIGFFAVGSNFRCGYRLDTDAEQIKEYFTSKNIEVEIVKEVIEGDKPVSSSRIREAIAKGDLDHVQKLLGRKYSF